MTSQILLLVTTCCLLAPLSTGCRGPLPREASSNDLASARLEQPGEPLAPKGGSRAFNDCNGNGYDDAEDIANGTSIDADANGIPDECEAGVVPQVADTAGREES